MVFEAVGVAEIPQGEGEAEKRGVVDPQHSKGQVRANVRRLSKGGQGATAGAGRNGVGQASQTSKPTQTP